MEVDLGAVDVDVSVGVGAAIGADSGAEFYFVAGFDNEAVEKVSVFGVASASGALVFIEFGEFVVDPDFGAFYIESVGAGRVGERYSVIAGLFDLVGEVECDR